MTSYHIIDMPQLQEHESSVDAYIILEEIGIQHIQPGGCLTSRIYELLQQHLNKHHNQDSGTKILSKQQNADDAVQHEGKLEIFEHGGQLYIFWNSRIAHCIKHQRAFFAEQNFLGDILLRLRNYNACKVIVDSTRLPKNNHPILMQLFYSMDVAYYPLPHYRTLQKHHNQCGENSIEVCMLVASDNLQAAEQARSTIAQIQSTAHASNFVRHMMEEPPNFLTPKSFVESIKQASEDYDLEYEFLSYSELYEMGAGAFCAVAGGDPHSGAGIVKVTYIADNAAKKGRQCDFQDISFVGKGITYDTGGVNVKPAQYMRGMKNDMTGASMAFAMVRLAKEQKWPVNVRAYLGIANNSISHTSYQPDDVVSSLSGLSIEVVHTDAEGRMVLADTLHLACQDACDLLIDYATLTGASVAAISRRYHSVYTNQPSWYAALIASGLRVGERVWPFPIDQDFADCLTSSVADTLQCRPQGGVDHIEAAMFLQKFITPGTPWLHMDLSHARTDKPMGHLLSQSTGAGVRFTCDFLQQIFDNS